MKYYLGLDLGGTNMTAGVVDENYKIIAKATRPTLAKRDDQKIIKDMYDVSVEAAQKVGMDIKDFTYWGIGMPSCVNLKNNLIVRANNFRWVNFPIFNYLKQYTDIPIHIENDANCAALGETLAGSASEYENVVMITIGTGLGGGIILNNTIYAGADSMGAELGHTKLVYDGIRCSCGQKGCAESYCSATALIRQMHESLIHDTKSLVWELCNKDLSLIDGKLIFEAVKKRDYLATKVVDQFIDYLSAALSTFITIFRPEAIVIGGGIADACDILFNKLREKTIDNTFAATEIGIPIILPAKLGNDAGIIGAAMLEKLEKEK